MNTMNNIYETPSVIIVLMETQGVLAASVLGAGYDKDGIIDGGLLLDDE